ncbi:S-layer homology domain-containing protein [Pseudalkalibacillus berkeleyi]|uniref:S-layer homology domain-containing protein n=1 Tax=Pseudalkalibacillus berkeleyi TaxID=1069813 RepID=A0ABS9H1H5_9BACL|nr:S-layer homology domain-containing protein [Pseudalkalibacillus berkeleyi]MCF6138837.1 S-layer homology domain-containing protein [Pseudalkalibacillus berkeleyi]
MKYFVKVVLGVALACIFALVNQGEASAESISSKCSYTPVNGENPDMSTTNCLLTEAALAKNVPPEIVKAIAEGESGNWRQFDSNGDPIVTSDNGIGIMQITNKSGYDEEKLKNDIVYNIEAGVKVLDEMYRRSDLPSINAGDRDVLEHWYFAIMAYNGTKPVNSPIVQSTGDRNTDAYQEKVLKIIDDLGLIKPQTLPFKSSDFKYDSNSSKNIEFITMDYHFTIPLTKTKHRFLKDDQVKTTTATRLRTGPSTDTSIKASLQEGEVLTVNGPFVYEKVADRKNHYVWYPVKRSDGSTGYVASSFLKFKFKDVPANYWAEDHIYYLYDSTLLYGMGNGQFGLGKNLTRAHAAILMNRAKNISTENRPDPGFTDVPKDHKYYDDIAAAVDEGLFVGVKETKFDPDATLTRAQMAVVLQRVYEFPKASNDHPFTDVKNGSWYDEAVTRLYDAEITAGVTKTKFGPDDKITREQFAVFMGRSIQYK